MDNNPPVDVLCSYTLQTNDGDAAILDSVFRLLARKSDGRKGLWVYQAFDYINDAFFSGDLPTPFISWQVTPYGRCLGSTSASSPAIIRLNPGLLGGQKVWPGKTLDTQKVWSVPLRWLGLPMVFDTILHECIHLSVDRLGGWEGKGSSSHDNDVWIAEVNRIAPELGLPGTAGRSKSIRVPIPGQFTKTGKPATAVKRGTTGTIPFNAVSTFPYGMREHLGLVDWFVKNQLPFPHVYDSLEHADPESLCNV